MDITHKQVGTVTVIAVKGSIDAITSPDITKHIQQQVVNGNVNLVMDLSGVDYTSSAGLRVLLGATKDTRSKNGDIRLTGIQPDVQKVLKLSGFLNILKTFDDVNAAVSSYS